MFSKFVPAGTPALYTILHARLGVWHMFEVGIESSKRPKSLPRGNGFRLVVLSSISLNKAEAVSGLRVDQAPGVGNTALRQLSESGGWLPSSIHDTR
jgi:hypothetical protein